MTTRSAPQSRRTVPRRRRGQSLTEAAVITFLVAVGAIGVVGLFGDNLRHLFGASADSIAGSTAVQNGGGKASAGLLKWGMKGSSTQGNPGGSAGAPTAGGEGGGNPGGTSNKTAHPGGPGGNPGGTTNSTPAHKLP